jgi:hypothetical protein
MKRTLFVVCCACLSTTITGCSGTVSPSQLEPPAAALLVPPKPLADPKKGDDLVVLYKGLRKDYAAETSKLRRLQIYTKTVLKK